MTRIVLAVSALTLLSACGIKGDLTRPDPLWNRQGAIRHECAQAARDNRPQDARCAQQESGAANSQTAAQPSPAAVSASAPPASPTQSPTQTTPQPQ